MRKNKNDKVLFIGTAITGLIALALSYGYMENRENNLRKQLTQEIRQKVLQKVLQDRPMPKVIEVVQAPEKLAILVAKRDVFRGERLSTDDVKMLEVPLEGIVVKGVITDPNEALGKITLQPLYAGEWILNRKLASIKNRGTGFSAMLDEGIRAMSVSLTKVTGMLNILEPDDRVDIVGIFQGEKRDQMQSKTLLQNIRVLAIGEKTMPGEWRKSNAKKQKKPDPKRVALGSFNASRDSVTFELSPHEAELLALITNVGSIRLVLRNKADYDVTKTKGSTMRTMTAGTGREAIQRSDRQIIEIIQGDQIRRKSVK